MALKKIVKKHKITKEDLDPTKDEFITKSMSILDWAVERRKQIGILLLVILLASIGGIILNHYNNDTLATTGDDLAVGLNSAFAPVVKMDDDDGVPKKRKDNEELSFETHEAKTTETLKRFEKIISNNDGSVIAQLAQLGKADALYDNGDFDKSIAAYKEFLKSENSDINWLTQNGLEGLAVALESAEQINEARAKWQELSKSASGNIALIAKYNDARLAEKKGEDKTVVIAMLKNVVDEITETGELDSLDYVFTEARARLLNLNPEADIPSIPGGGLDGIDPMILKQLMEAQQLGGGGLK